MIATMNFGQKNPAGSAILHYAPSRTLKKHFRGHSHRIIACYSIIPVYASYTLAWSRTALQLYTRKPIIHFKPLELIVSARRLCFAPRPSVRASVRPSVFYHLISGAVGPITATFCTHIPWLALQNLYPTFLTSGPSSATMRPISP